MDIPSIQPPKLQPSGIIRIIAPASTVEDRANLERGISALERMGFRPRYDERIFHSSRYLAGDDRSRAEELMQAFEDPSVQAIMSLRGGYGCARLIPLLEERRLRPNPKIFIGFSDLTTLHLYFRRRFGWITIHGPMAATRTIDSMPADQESHFLSLLTDPEYRPSLTFDEFETWAPGTAEGVIIGGCLSIITTSIGTCYEIKTEGRILFIEDQGEPPYRLDRMLTHLRLAGKLDSVGGILLGSFPDCDNGKYKASEVLRDILSDLNIPILAHFPAGHENNNWAIPLGSKVRLNADTRSIEFLHPAVKEREAHST